MCHKLSNLFRAKAWVTARPMPELAPVTKATEVHPFFASWNRFKSMNHYPVVEPVRQKRWAKGKSGRPSRPDIAAPFSRLPGL